MKRLSLALLLCAGAAASAFGQGAPPFRLCEVDNIPCVLSPTRINVSNSTLTCTGKTCTITTGGGSPGGSDTQLQYNNAGALGGVSGATSNGTNVTFGSGNLIATSPTFSGTVGAAAATFSGTVVQTSASATAFESGPNGGTNPVFRLVNNVASAATGLSITGRAAGAGVDITALSSGSNEPITIAAKGTGQILASGGTSGSPVYSFAGATSSGMRVSSGHVVFDVSGVQSILRLFADTGRVEANASFGFAIGTDVGLSRKAASVMRVDNASTGAGSLIIGTSAGAVGTGGAGVLAFTLSTAPSTSPADTVQAYSNDSAAGDHNLFARNEAGEINRLTGLSARNSSAFAKTSDTSLANITGLARNVEASRAYAFRAVLETTAAATGGVKFAVSGTATATSINYEGILYNGAAVVAQTRATALDTTVCAVTNATAATCVIEGVIVVNAAGTLTIQFAQNASDGGASTVLINQYLQLIPIS